MCIDSVTFLHFFALQSTCIDMAQTILDAKVPELPEARYSPEFRQFLRACLCEDPHDRRSAEDMLSFPWLFRYDATNLDSARNNVFEWIQSIHNRNKF